MIRARTRCDDGAFPLEFDAEEWFESANDNTILRLCDDDWGYSLTADSILDFYYDANREIREMSRYMEELNIGYEVRVYTEDAIEWVQANRPHLFDYVNGDIPYGHRPQEGIGGRITWGPPS
jgi:hypothetical protein